MARYRKKPVVINAARFDGTKESVQVILDLSANQKLVHAMSVVGDELMIPTLEGTMRADVGDWIICGVKGELYPCKPEIFEATYELAPEA